MSDLWAGFHTSPADAPLLLLGAFQACRSLWLFLGSLLEAPQMHQQVPVRRFAGSRRLVSAVLKCNN